MMPPQIANDQLKPANVPPRTADWQDINRFALTFNGYEAQGSNQACAIVANERRHETLTDLRTCLFFEQRKWNHRGSHPDPETEEYFRGLLDQIRAKLPNE